MTFAELNRGLPNWFESNAGSRRYFDRWNLVGLLLLPTLYWGLDLVWHTFFLNPRVLLLVNLVLQVVVSLAALLCWTIWNAKLARCASLPLTTLLGIYLGGPTYMLLSEWLLGAHVRTSSQELISTWVSLTLLFPMSTLSLSTYDLTLPAPFLTWFGVWMIGRIYSKRLHSHSSHA